MPINSKLMNKQSVPSFGISNEKLVYTSIAKNSYVAHDVTRNLDRHAAKTKMLSLRKANFNLGNHGLSFKKEEMHWKHPSHIGLGKSRSNLPCKFKTIKSHESKINLGHPRI